MLIYLFFCLCLPLTYRYESSGYDEASFRRVYSPYQKLPPQQFQQPHQQQQQQHQQQQQQSFRTEEQHTIESGPSFNESLERFRIATSSGGESDGGGGAGGDFSPSPAGKTSSVFRQRQQQQQQHYSATTTSSQRTTRAMEEQRTMITRSSQKSYHIEWKKENTLKNAKKLPFFDYIAHPAPLLLH